jgi:hypothetical protein
MSFTSFGDNHGMLSGSSVSCTFDPYCGGLLLYGAGGVLGAEICPV